VCTDCERIKSSDKMVGCAVTQVVEGPSALVQAHWEMPLTN